MPSKNKAVLLSVFLGALIWLMDAGLDYFVFYEGPFLDLLILDVPEHEIYIRIVILGCFLAFGLIMARIIARLEEADRRNRLLISDLQKAIADVKRLSGFLPICASCKKIRDDKGYWNQIESYIKDHSEADFSHGICPECAGRLYPGLDNRGKKTGSSGEL